MRVELCDGSSHRRKVVFLCSEVLCVLCVTAPRLWILPMKRRIVQRTSLRRDPCLPLRFRRLPHLLLRLYHQQQQVEEQEQEQEQEQEHLRKLPLGQRRRRQEQEQEQEQEQAQPRWLRFWRAWTRCPCPPSSGALRSGRVRWGLCTRPLTPATHRYGVVGEPHPSYVLFCTRS